MLPLKDDNPTRLWPIVSHAVLGTCGLLRLWQAGLGPEAGQRAVYAFGLIPAVLTGRAQSPPAIAAVPPAGTLLTAMCLHGYVSQVVHLPAVAVLLL